MYVKLHCQFELDIKAPFTRHNLLSNRLSESDRFDNRLYRVNGVRVIGFGIIGRPFCVVVSDISCADVSYLLSRIVVLRT